MNNNLISAFRFVSCRTSQYIQLVSTLLSNNEMFSRNHNYRHFHLNNRDPIGFCQTNHSYGNGLDAEYGYRFINFGRFNSTETRGSEIC